LVGLAIKREGFLQMGLFSYECKHCKSSIRFDGYKGETAILFHVKHNEIIGQTVGEYDGYGGVKEDTEFNRNKTSLNSSEAIFESRHKLSDSNMFSGISAYHHYCYRQALKYNKDLLKNLRMSQLTDDQGRGKLRKNYCKL
jgi:hypothetical protein